MRIKETICAVGLATFAAGIAYGEDPYIESTGTSGISTGYRMKGTSRVEVDFAIPDISNPAGWQNWRIFGSDWENDESSLLTCLWLSYNSGNGATYFRLNAKTASSAKADKYMSGVDTARHTAILDLPNSKMVILTGTTTNAYSYATGPTGNDKTTNAGIDFSGFEADLPLSLFARFYTTTVKYANPSKVRIYGVKVYENGEIVRDFVPCLRDGVACFKDLVGGSFIVGENVSAFTAGGDNVLTCADDGYVSTLANASGGKLYIDTDYKATAKTAVALDCALAVNTNLAGTIWKLFEGGWDPYYGFNINGNNGLRYNAGGTTYLTGFTTMFKDTLYDDKDVRRTFFLDNLHSCAAVATSGFTNQTTTFTASNTKTQTWSVKIATSWRGTNEFAAIKIYGCKIWEDGVLVRDFVPCVQYGVPGLRDRLTGAFKPGSDYSGGGNQLAYGGAIEQDSYLESNGTTGLNTGYKMNGNSRLEVDFALPDVSEPTVWQNWRIFGSDYSTDESSLLTCLWLSYNSGNGATYFRLNAKTASSTKADKYLSGVDTARHTAILDLPNSKMVILTGTTTNAYSYATGPNGDDRTTNAGIDFSGREADLPLSLFARFYTSTARYANPSKVRIYSVRIYESDVLAHEFLPYGVGAVTGLYDTVTGEVVSDGSSFTFGGVGQDHGQLKTYIKPGYSAKLVHRGTTTLTAYAPGATSYKWLMDGLPIAGGTDGVLSAEWARGGTKTDDGYIHTYQAIAVYDDFHGGTREGAPSSSATITSDLVGMAIIIK